MGWSSRESAMIVGFCFRGDSQIFCNSSEEASPSQSITTKSAVPCFNMSTAFEELRQTLVLTERSRSTRLMLHSTSGFPDTSKPSNAMSGVIIKFLQDVAALSRKDWRSRHVPDMSIACEVPRLPL